MHCPGCDTTMQRLALDAALGHTIEVDLCTSCRAFWFDPYETLQLKPASTLKLFHLIADAGTGGTATPSVLHCPKCRTVLKHSYDRQRSTRFEYWRCEREHGRFTRFNDFLKEKNFVQALSADEIAKLRRKVQMINCSNCGAPVDLVKESSCRHCASPLVMLDRDAMQRVANDYQRAANARPAPPLPAARFRDSSSLSLLDIDLENVADWVIRLLRL